MQLPQDPARGNRTPLVCLIEYMNPEIAAECTIQWRRPNVENVPGIPPARRGTIYVKDPAITVKWLTWKAQRATVEWERVALDLTDEQADAKLAAIDQMFLTE